MSAGTLGEPIDAKVVSRCEDIVPDHTNPVLSLVNEAFEIVGSDRPRTPDHRSL